MVIRWSLMVLAASATAGMGLFIFGSLDCFRKQGGETRLFLMSTAFVMLLAGLVVHIAGLGTPSNALGMLSHIMSGFSMATMGVALLCVLLIIIIARVALGKDIPTWLPALGLVLVVCICYGLSVVFTKSSRPALHHWFIPLYIAAVTVMAGSYGHLFFSLPASRGVGAARLLSLVLVAVAVLAFLVNLNGIGFTDRYLNMQIINGGMAGWFYCGTVAAGLGIPLAVELVTRFANGGKIIALIGWIGVIAGSVSFFTIVNVV